LPLSSPLSSARSRSPPCRARGRAGPPRTWPPSPFNWKLIGTAGDDHSVAGLNVFGHGPLLPARLPRFVEIAAATPWQLYRLRYFSERRQRL